MTDKAIPFERKPATVPPAAPSPDETKIQVPDAGEIEWAGNLVKQPPGAGTPEQLPSE